MDRQSEWITLRRVHAFLKSRGLKATAYELEQEARLKFDYPRVRGLLSRGRWRAADVYVSSFLGDNLTPEASDTLFVIRFERFVSALKRGDRAWAARYYDRSVRPVLANHPYKTTVITDCLNALLASARSLRRDHPDNAWYRERCVIKFMCRIHCNKQLHRCKKSFLHDRFTRYKMEGAFGAFGALGLRRHARRRSTAR